jgi:hypothetical protein
VPHQSSMHRTTLQNATYPLEGQTAALTLMER